MMRLIDIHKSFVIGDRTVEILKGVDLDISKGEMVSIVGASGSGKSTFMNIIGLLDSPTSGRYLLDGAETFTLNDQELSSVRNRTIGFVFQQFNLLPKLTALENVCLPLSYRGTPEKEQVEIAREKLALVKMTDRVDHRPSELSGGQQQRVAIARALAGRPGLILADEPTGALDTHTSREIMEIFLKLNGEEGITVVLITHDPGLARECPRAVCIRDGRIVETLDNEPDARAGAGG